MDTAIDAWVIWMVRLRAHVTRGWKLGHCILLEIIRCTRVRDESGRTKIVYAYFILV